MELELITKSLVLLESALNMFGKKVSADLVLAYAAAFEYRGLSDRALIERTTAWFLANSDRFPTPAAFIDKAFELQGEQYVAIGVPVGDDTVRIELVPVGEQMAEPRRVPCLDSVATPSRQVPDLSPRELPPPMDEAETEAERRRQLDALRGDQ